MRYLRFIVLYLIPGFAIEAWAEDLSSASVAPTAVPDLHAPFSKYSSKIHEIFRLVCYGFFNGEVSTGPVRDARGRLDDAEKRWCLCHASCPRPAAELSFYE